jgi:hypothetical protein
MAGQFDRNGRLYFALRRVLPVSQGSRHQSSATAVSDRCRVGRCNNVSDWMDRESDPSAKLTKVSLCADTTMTTQWQPYREPVAITLARTGAVAAAVGAGLAVWWGGGPARWPAATLLALWPALGGHFVELWSLNWLSPRIGSNPAAQTLARILVWFVGGCILAMGMDFSAMALGSSPTSRWPAWSVGGLAFVGIELIVHLVLLVGGSRTSTTRGGLIPDPDSIPDDRTCTNPDVDGESSRLCCRDQVDDSRIPPLGSANADARGGDVKGGHFDGRPFYF